MKTHRIILSPEVTDVNDFCMWLNTQGHHAAIGNSDYSYLDNQSTYLCTDARNIFNSLWDKFDKGGER